MFSIFDICSTVSTLENDEVARSKYPFKLTISFLRNTSTLICTFKVVLIDNYIRIWNDELKLNTERHDPVLDNTKEHFKARIMTNRDIKLVMLQPPNI